LAGLVLLNGVLFFQQRQAFLREMREAGATT
jgi:hypothetical protein